MPSHTSKAAEMAPQPGGAGARSPTELLIEQERLLLIEATRRLTRCLEPSRVIHEMLQLMSELIGLNRGRVVLPEVNDAAGLSIVHAYGLTREEIDRGRYRWGEGITGKVMASGSGAIVQDIDADPGFLFRAVERNTLPAGVVSFIAVPVMGTHGQLGVLGVHRLRARPRPLAHDLTLLSALAALIGQVLQVNRLVSDRTAVLEQENHRLRQALRSQSGAGPAPVVRHYEWVRADELPRLLAAVQSAGGNRARAARELGLSARQLSYRLKQLQDESAAGA